MAEVYAANIEDVTKDNTNFRTVLWTGEYSQLTVMSIPPGSEIGLEVHPTIDQFLRLEKGHAKLVTGPTEAEQPNEVEIKSDWAVIIPAGTWHNIINTGDKDLKVYSAYSPANHPADAVHVTKADADAAEEAEHAAEAAAGATAEVPTEEPSTEEPTATV
jgi:mannose-6-phosphate isomerase-like protein (cupin superfamily)